MTALYFDIVFTTKYFYTKTICWNKFFIIGGWGGPHAKENIQTQFLMTASYFGIVFKN